jgi:hypothetical protein
MTSLLATSYANQHQRTYGERRSNSSTKLRETERSQTKWNSIKEVILCYRILTCFAEGGSYVEL